MAQQQQQAPTNYTPFLIAAGVLLLYNKIFGKSETEKAAATQEKSITDVPLSKNPFTTEFVVGARPKNTITARTTKTYPAVPSGYYLTAAKMFDEGIHWYKRNDASKMIAALKMAKTKGEISIMADTYKFFFKKDLWVTMKDAFTDEHLLEALQYVNKLPNYITGHNIK